MIYISTELYVEFTYSKCFVKYENKKLINIDDNSTGK